MTLCEHVILREGRFKLTKNEEVLVCGSNKSEEGWREVPLPQAQYELNVIFHNRGYLNPRFVREGRRLYVWPGPLTKTTTLHLQGGAGLIHAVKKRKIVGFPLESKKLDEVKKWADLAMRRNGYACPTINVVAHSWDGLMVASIASGEQKTIGLVDRTGTGNLDQQSLSRYEAFRPGDRYDVIATQITAARLLSHGLFQSSYFNTKCRDDKVDLHLFTEIGKSRLVRFGLGASTEELPFADLWFKNTRLDDRASSYTAALHGSPIRQSLNVSAELYVVPYSKRSFLGPRFKVERRAERAYELIRSGLGADLGREWDLHKLKQRWGGRIGPTFNYEKTVRGIGPAEYKYLSWEGSLKMMSHEYEAFSLNQYEGYTAHFEYRGQRRGVGSPINVDKYEMEFKYLWNLGSYAPPLFILGTRVQAIAVDSRRMGTVQERQSLPIDYRIFYGGNENLRGFARQSLNNGGLGYLTVLNGGFELRLIEELPYRLEPFLLWDVARLGDQRYTLERPIYISYGGGLRWPSPFGTLRGSIAKGAVWNGDQTTAGYKQEVVLFLSFGQEF